MALNRTVAASLFVLAATVVFAVVLGFVLAFQPATVDPMEERWARLGVAEPEIVFLGDFTEKEQAAITRELKSVQVAFAQRFDVVTSDFTLYISTEHALVNEAFLDLHEFVIPDWFTCGGLVQSSAVFIVLETCDDDVRERGGPIAHEYFHILQYHLGLVAPSNQIVWRPSWLVEGSAVYASTHHAEGQGRSTVSWRREAARLAWSGLGRPPGRCRESL